MLTVGLYVRLEAKPGKEGELETFLRDALPLAKAELKTSVWYAVKFGPSTFAIFDGFENEEGREDHINGAIAAALMSKAGELLTVTPVIERWDVLGAK